MTSTKERLNVELAINYFDAAITIEDKIRAKSRLLATAMEFTTVADTENEWDNTVLEMIRKRLEEK